jgi:glutamyl-tRNA reductase
MHIYCLGISHASAPLSLLEELTLGEEGTRLALARVSHGTRPAPFAELVIVSTCNRIEFYAASARAVFRELEAFLSEVSGIEPIAFRAHAYRVQDLEAAGHLHEVAAGLDSLVVGEPQILGQVTRALELAREQNVAGPLLNQLFQSAIHAGKRVRTETEIGRNPVSVSSLAASLAARIVQPLTEAQVLILGAGEMAELAMGALRKRGVTHATVVNRTLEHARSLADRWQAQAATYEHLDRLLEAADVLISSTGAPHFVVSVPMVESVMQRRPERPLILIDIAVPRDIDPEVSSIPRVQLHDMESLNGQVEESRLRRLGEVPRVREILEEELLRFAQYLESLAMRPLIAGIRQQAEALRQAELAATFRHLPNLTEDEREHIDLMTRALMKKFLETPTRRLQAESTCPHAPAYAAVARTLFGLMPEAAHCGFSDELCPIASASAD